MMDRKKQRQIWQRVYGQTNQPRRYSPQELEQCYRRELALYDHYDRYRDDPVYGPAFARLAEEAMAHCKMLQTIMGK